MTTTLVHDSAEHADQQVTGRVSLDKLAALGTDRITAALHRVLPSTESGQLAVAAFNSSI